MHNLPNELIGHIFSFDNTFHEYFKRYIVRQLKNQVFFRTNKSIYSVINLKEQSNSLEVKKIQKLI